MVVHGFPYHSCEYFLVLESQAAAASEGMQGTLGTLSHRPRPLGGHLIKFDFPSILIEARSMMAEANFPHHCRKLWGTMTEGMVFFKDAGEHRIPSDTKHPETKKWGIYTCMDPFGVCFTLEGWDYFGLFGCIQ